MVYGEFITKPALNLAKLLAKNLPKNLNSTYFTNSGNIIHQAPRQRSIPKAPHTPPKGTLAPTNTWPWPPSLLCDENKDVINSFGVWGLKKFMGKEYMGINRATFIIDEKGKILNIIDKVKTKDHTNQIIG